MKFLTLLALVIMPSMSWAYIGCMDNRCNEFRHEGYVRSICRGHDSLPVNRTRNFQQNTQHLECSSNSDNYTRRPQKFDFNEWSTQNASGDQMAAYHMRRNLPEMKWQGAVPYETLEVWDWQSCECHTNGAECGYHEEEETYQDCHSVSDGDGKSHQECETKTRMVSVPNACYYDVTYTETEHCSDESMSYEVKFNRKPEQEWNPKTTKFAQIIPNGYDLLPGEIENIATYDANNRTTTLNPFIKILNGWNDYNISNASGSAAGAACVQGAHYNASFTVDTVKRHMGARPPNALKLPVDMDGHAVDSLQQWTVGVGKDGKPVKVIPGALLLSDSSAAMIQSISEVSRKAAPREIEKIKNGTGSNADGAHLGDPNDQLSQAFMRDTMIRVRLYEVNSMWFDQHLMSMYYDSNKVARASNNAFSKDQEIANAEEWQLPLTYKGYNLSQMTQWGLRPNRVYELDVSMYQKGVPFYSQDCSSQPHQWACLGMGIPLKPEAWYYSPDLAIRFETSDRAKIESTFMQKLSFYSDPLNVIPINPLLEWIVHKRTTGANQ